MDQDGDYEDGQESSGKGLRGQLEQALADKKALEAEVAELRGKARQTEVSNVLTAKGVNPKVAKFIPADVEGEEGISKWLEENADLFGATPKTTTLNNRMQGSPRGEGIRITVAEPW